MNKFSMKKWQRVPLAFYVSENCSSKNLLKLQDLKIIQNEF
jgi:hypothetical protein